jgi:hypothetical protein
MEEKELNVTTVRHIRTGLVLGGTALGYLALLPDNQVLVYSMLVVATCMSVYGSYLWAKLKARHWLWMVFGLLAPAGFLILLFLRDKSHHAPPPQSP